MVAAALSGLFLTPPHSHPPHPPPFFLCVAGCSGRCSTSQRTDGKKSTSMIFYKRSHLHTLHSITPRLAAHHVHPPPYCFPFYITRRNTKACRRVRPSASGSVASGITVPLQAMEVLQKEKSADHCRITSEAILDALVRHLQAAFFLDGEFELESNQRSGTLRDASKVHFAQTETEENKESCRSPDVH